MFFCSSATAAATTTAPKERTPLHHHRFTPSQKRRKMKSSSCSFWYKSCDFFVGIIWYSSFYWLFRVLSHVMNILQLHYSWRFFDSGLDMVSVWLDWMAGLWSFMTWVVGHMDKDITFYMVQVATSMDFYDCFYACFFLLFISLFNLHLIWKTLSLYLSLVD